MSAQYAVGIDLGTTNSVVAYVPLSGEECRVELLAIPQLVSAGTVEARSSLPSFLLLAASGSAGERGLDLPWQSGNDFAVGELARRESAEAPQQTVAAAKSWLAYSRVDRRQAILPVGAEDDAAKVSPVRATQYYLEHLAAAWEQAFPDAPLAEQQVVLTVPASFDASARDLTREAALAAGLPEDLVLLEEPQSAIYAWLNDQGDHWRRILKVGETLLVCDVGGGTTDLTLVGVEDEEGDLVLKRVAVGNHLLVGGDNMDLALAHHVAERFQKKGVALDPWQSVALWHSCRAAKETLFAEDGPKKHPITVLGRGSKLIGGSVSVDVDRKSLAALLLEGFFPACGTEERPAKQRVSGFRELGLPYETDTAVTRHLAAFLHAHAAGAAPVQPTHVLLNGGVFKAELFGRRLLEVLGGWAAADAKPALLEGAGDFDHAVARGAACYGRLKQHGGMRIRGGTARSYYVGIETAGLAIPSAPRPLKAVCVAPFGMEEGTEVDVPSDEIGLIVGEPAQFRFFSSAVRKEDQPGATLTHWSEDELAETDSLETTLEARPDLEDDYVPVRFHSKITELGLLELWCASTIDDARWKLEFSVRDDAESV